MTPEQAREYTWLVIETQKVSVIQGLAGALRTIPATHPAYNDILDEIGNWTKLLRDQREAWWGPRNRIDLSATPAEKVEQLWKIICRVVEGLENSDPRDVRKKKVFMLRIAWFESCLDDRIERTNTGLGPARGLFQEQKNNAIDALRYITRSPHVCLELLKICPCMTEGFRDRRPNESDEDYAKAVVEYQISILENYTQPDPVYGEDAHFPPDNCIKKCLEENDYFATILARYYFKRDPEPLPEPDEVDKAFEFWDRLWYRSGADNEDKTRWDNKMEVLSGLLPE